MTLSGLQDRAAAIDALLSVARRETLVLVIAVGALDDATAAVASSRLRWAIDAARQLITTSRPDRFHESRARQLDRIANRAQCWLVTEPSHAWSELGELVERGAAGCDANAPAIDARRASLADLDLDELDLCRIALHGATLIDVTARRTEAAAADARVSRWLRCELEGSSLAMAVLSDSNLQHCELSTANLEGASWLRASLSHCTLRRARLVDARLDRAVLSDCNLRGADLGISKSPAVASLAGARFVRCDLRETHWAGRDLAGAVFIDCKLFGAHGAPSAAGVVIERADLSLTADGSQIGTQRDVVAAWRTMVGASSIHARM
jgi:uncharacterized protein YjbI with pentapeptide repeats